MLKNNRGCHRAKIKTETRWPSAVRFIPLQTFFNDLLRNSMRFHSVKETSFVGRKILNLA